MCIAGIRSIEKIKTEISGLDLSGLCQRMPCLYDMEVIGSWSFE